MDNLSGRRLSGFSLVSFVMALAVLLGPESLLHAQDTTGSISGTVTDTTGAIVAGATVVAHRMDTNADTQTTTSSDGTYSFNLMPPAVYRITVTESGFKSFQQDNLTLTINERAQANATLEVGATDQKVTITAAPPTIQTQDSSVGLVVDAATIVNTPLNGRLNITGLLALAPGIQNAGAQDQIPIYGITPSVGGASPYGSIGFSLDGATNTSVFLQRGYGEYPPLDGLQEFKTITTGAAAEFTQPTQIVVLSRGGANAFHGTLVYFNRNRFLAAKQYFAGSLPLPKYNRNEFGGNFSGPIVIPHLYNGRDKSFFFFNFERFTRRQANTINTLVPTLKERAGDFSEAPAAIYNPFTGQPFAGNSIAGSINAVSLALQNALFPLPNVAGAAFGKNNLVQNLPLIENANRYSFRIDHQLTQKDHLSGSFLAGLFGPNNATGTTSLFGGMAGIGEHNLNTIVNWTHTFSPSLISQLTASYIHEPIFRTPQNYQTNFQAIIPGLPTQPIEGAPQLSITNIASVSEAGSRDLDQTIQLNYIMTKSLRAHNIKFGVTVLRSNHWNTAAIAPQRGSYQFTGTYTNNPATKTGGVAYADFLLGYPLQTQVSNPAVATVRFLQTQYGGFVQDDWRATPRLTINAGIRYDFQYQEDNPYGLNALYVPSLKSIVVFANQMPAAVQPGVAAVVPVVLAKNVGLPSKAFGYLGQDPNNIAPRFGFAYQVAQSTVIRGAFGIFFDLLPTDDTIAPMSQGLPFYATQTFASTSSTVPSLSMSNPFPSGAGAVSANPNAVAEHSPVTPYEEQYNLTLEHQLPKGVGFRIGYVGLRNLKQNNFHGSGGVFPDLNAVTPAPGAVQARRPVQPFGSISLELDPIFSSTMNSFQAGLHKQYSSGLTVNAEYEWIRVLGNENFQNSLTTNDSYGNISGIRPQQLVVSYSYDLPFGRGKYLFGKSNGLADRVIGGWVLSGISTFQTGQPFSVSASAGPTGDVGGRANVVPGQPLYPAKRSISEWFNPAAFVKAPLYTYGTSAYDMLWGPGYQNWDASIAKRTKLTEGSHLELRLDAFNVFNHPQFSNPNASVSNAGNVGTITGTAGTSRTLQLGGKFQF